MTGGRGGIVLLKIDLNICLLFLHNAMQPPCSKGALEPALSATRVMRQPTAAPPMVARAASAAAWAGPAAEPLTPSAGLAPSVPHPCPAGPASKGLWSLRLGLGGRAAAAGGSSPGGSGTAAAAAPGAATLTAPSARIASASSALAPAPGAPGVMGRGGWVPGSHYGATFASPQGTACAPACPISHSRRHLTGGAAHRRSGRAA